MKLNKWRHYLGARLLELLRQPDLAIAGYRQALGIDPQFRRAANALAYRCALSGHDRDAIECFEQVLRLDARDADARYNLGFIYARAGEPRKAIESFRLVAELKPNFDLAWYGMGLAYATVGEHREAMEAFGKAAQLQQMSAPVWYQLGMACHHAHEPERLREVIHHLNRFDPLVARRLILETGSTDLSHLVKDLVV